MIRETGLRGEGHQWEAADTDRQTDNKSYLGVDRGIRTGSVYTKPLLDFVPPSDRDKTASSHVTNRSPSETTRSVCKMRVGYVC